MDDPSSTAHNLTWMRMATSVMREAASELGVDASIDEFEKTFMRLTPTTGPPRFLRSHLFDLNGAAATEVANNKAVCAHFLIASGYPVPRSKAFRRDECDWVDAYRVTADIGVPAIIKPNSKTHGAAVFSVHSAEEFRLAAEEVWSVDRVLLVQELAKGIEFRLTVLDGEVITGYMLTPLTVVGDGVSTINSLLLKKQQTCRSAGHEIPQVSTDRRIEIELRTANLTPDSIPDHGASHRILPVANLSAGGQAHNVLYSLHAEWKAIAASVCHDLGLRYAGVDIISKTSYALAPDSFVILEVNAAPSVWVLGLQSGTTSDRDEFKRLYRRLIVAMFSKS